MKLSTKSQSYKPKECLRQPRIVFWTRKMNKYFKSRKAKAAQKTKSILEKNQWNFQLLANLKLNRKKVKSAKKEFFSNTQATTWAWVP